MRNRVLNCSSTYDSRTVAMSATRITWPSGLALTTMPRIASARSTTPIVRMLMLPTLVRTVPPGTSVIQAPMSSLTCGRLRRCSRSAAEETSTRISYSRTPVRTISPMSGRVLRSSRMSWIARLRASSSASPKRETMITGSRGWNSETWIRSASCGRSRNASIARSISSVALVTSTPSRNSTTRPPPPSEIVVVRCSTFSSSASLSSTFMARLSSISCGVAPG